MASKSIRKREPNWARELLKEPGIKDINGIQDLVKELTKDLIDVLFFYFFIALTI